MTRHEMVAVWVTQPGVFNIRFWMPMGLTSLHLARDSYCQQVIQLLQQKSKVTVGVDSPVRRRDVDRHHRTRTETACNPSKT